MRFAFRYGRGLRWFFTAIGLGPAHSRVLVSSGRVEVRMGWAFRSRFAAGDVKAASPSGNVWWAIGVHTDFRGNWLVNGATSGIVWLQLDPRPRAWCLGIPVRPRRLGLGLEEPEAFLAALGAPPATT